MGLNMFNRSAGVFLNISSLPSDFGIGDFGKGSLNFIDLLADMHMKWWQILPLCPIGGGNSPYSSVSAFAVNPLYVDLEKLQQEGYLSQEDVDKAKHMDNPYSVDYDYAKKVKEECLRKAFHKADKQKLDEFANENKFWINDYARFMATMKINDDKNWTEWEKECSEEGIQYYIFEQYIVNTQWKSVRAYAKQKGVSILGDMPIYVSHNSADFWSNKRLFLSDSDGKLAKVAGVPPDYFAKEGQLWGNPLYNWEVMKSDGYSWWISRIKSALDLYDAVRIDHFRGFYQYWAVPAEAKTAKAGKWENGPAMELFELVNKTFGNPQIIAEDLGVSDEKLVDFVKETGYPGMKVMQFGFASYDSDHMPYKYTSNSIAYTGTHDNDTMLGWLWAISPSERSLLLKYCRFTGDDWGKGGEKSEVIRAIITTLWQSSAAITMVPIQDICGFGGDTRLNIPGEPDGNWRFRITDEALKKIDVDFYRELNEVYGRG